MKKEKIFNSKNEYEKIHFQKEHKTFLIDSSKIYLEKGGDFAENSLRKNFKKIKNKY